MKVRDFFGNSEVQLPIVRDDQDFHSFVDAKLRRYRELAADLTEDDPVSQAVRSRKAATEECCSRLSDTIKATLRGQPFDAYKHLSDALSAVKSELDRLAIRDLTPTGLGFLYRVRRQLTPPLGREGLFHIPFEERYRVATQRYSIPGLPCLYLAGSLYTCWCELGQPALHKLQVAAFWQKKDRKTKLINFSWRPARLLLLLAEDGTLPPEKEKQELLATHIVLWPLMALCSIIVKYPQMAYKPEYTIPQILLQWITREHDYDGICYFSTHVPRVTNDPRPVCNFIFPARDVKPKGRCPRLRDLFKLTEPYSWQLLRAIQAKRENEGAGMPPQFDFEFISGLKEQYGSTEFGMVQGKLTKLARDIIYRNENGEPDLGDVEE
jgi:hypothetical protein